VGVKWSGGGGEGARAHEEGCMLLSGDGDAVGSLRMAMASGGRWGRRARGSSSPVRGLIDLANTEFEWAGN
jgi:hypothetical protein